MQVSHVSAINKTDLSQFTLIISLRKVAALKCSRWIMEPVGFLSTPGSISCLTRVIPSNLFSIIHQRCIVNGSNLK